MPKPMILLLLQAKFLVSADFCSAIFGLIILCGRYYFQCLETNFEMLEWMKGEECYFVRY